MSDEIVFIAMPFSEEYRSVFDKAIDTACKRCNLIAYRADEYQTASKPMIGEMVENMHKCKLFIADITMERPNVFYEIGYLSALGKKGFFISQLRANPPHYIFDYPLIRYKPGPENLEKLIIRISAEIEKVLNEIAILNNEKH